MPFFLHVLVLVRPFAPESVATQLARENDGAPRSFRCEAVGGQVDYGHELEVLVHLARREPCFTSAQRMEVLSYALFSAVDAVETELHGSVLDEQIRDLVHIAAST